MTINLHSLFQGCNPKVLDTFMKLTKKLKEDETKAPVGGTKADKLFMRAAEHKANGKSIERALADACSDFKIAGAVP